MYMSFSITTKLKALSLAVSNSLFHVTSCNSLQLQKEHIACPINSGHSIIPCTKHILFLKPEALGARRQEKRRIINPFGRFSCIE